MSFIETSILHVRKQIKGSVASTLEICYLYKTLPKYFKYEHPRVDLVTEWIDQDFSSGNLNFSDFFSKVTKVFPDIPEVELLKLWLARSKDALQDGALVFYVQMSVNNLLDVETFLRYDAEDFLKSVERDVALVMEKYTREQKVETSLEGQLVPTDFIPTRKVFIARIPEEIPLDVLFDKFLPTSDVPFCAYGGLYKYLPTYDIEESYTVSTTAVLLLREYDGTTLADITTEENSVKVRFYVSVEKSENDVFEKIFTSLNVGSSDDIEITPLSAQGLVYFLGYTVGKYTFADFIMNNAIASSLFSLGESGPLTRKSTATRIYMHEPNVTASFSPKVFAGCGPDTKYIIDKVSDGDQYIRVFVTRASSSNDITTFINTLSRVLYLYTKEYHSIDKIYRSYIPSFPPRIQLYKQVTVPKERELDPHIFLPNYSRTCPNMPSPLRPGENLENIIEFPKGSGKFYTCRDKDYKYPGVRENTLSNSDEYPFVPCCFKTDQTTKPNYLKYYSEEKQYRYVQIRMITTLKPLNKNFFGVLPQNINTILTSLNTDKAYVRYGVSQSPSSFLECLNVALGRSERRERLANKVNVAMCLQENPGVSLKQIRAELLDNNYYLDPKKYIKILENFFDVDIFIFRSDEIVIPNHVEGYYKYVSTKRRCVLIYEQVDVKQCEIISEWDQEEGTYTHVHNMSSDLSDVQDKVYTYWIGERKLVPILRPDYLSSCISQYVDVYGKTRGLLLEIDGEKVYVETSPLPPINVPLTSKVQNTLQSENTFIRKYSKYIDTWCDGVYTSFPKKSIPLLNIVKNNARVAKYLTNVFLFLYSRWMYSTGLTDVHTFVESNIKVSETVAYNISSPETGTVDSLLDDGKLVLRSQKMLDKLIFVLQRDIQLYPQKIKAMHKLKYFENFYVDIDDFSTGDFIISSSIPSNNDQIISIDNYINPQKDSFYYSIVDTIYYVTRTDNDYTSNIVVYNSPDDVHVLKASERTDKLTLMYKTGGEVRSYNLQKV